MCYFSLQAQNHLSQFSPDSLLLVKSKVVPKMTTIVGDVTGLQQHHHLWYIHKWPHPYTFKIRRIQFITGKYHYGIVILCSFFHQDLETVKYRQVSLLMGYHCTHSCSHTFSFLWSLRPPSLFTIILRDGATSQVHNGLKLHPIAPFRKIA